MDNLIMELYNEIAKLFNYDSRYEVTFKIHPARDSLGDRGTVYYAVRDTKTNREQSWVFVPNEVMRIPNIGLLKESLLTLKEGLVGSADYFENNGEENFLDEYL